jgi:hypothetical protein
MCVKHKTENMISKPRAKCKKENGKKQNTSQQKREIELLKWVKYYENVDNIRYDLSVQYLFYTDGDNAKLHNIEPYA